MKVALFQAQTGVDPAANGAELVARVHAAAAGGAAMLFTPEMSGLLDRNRERAAAHLRREGEDPVLAAVRAAASEAGIWVHLGSLALLAERGDKLVNRGFVIDDEGGIRARYDKIHLFDVDLADRRELARIGRLSRRRPRRRRRDAIGAARPLDLL